MNLPNAITVSRLILTAVFVVGASLERPAGHWLALVSFVIAAISDFFDGWLARRMGLVTSMGKLLDPLADKVLVCAAYVYLSAKGLCPMWITVAILAREFLVTGIRQIAVEAGHVLAADQLGKWKTGLQLTFCITCLVWLALEPIAADEGLNPVLGTLRWLTHPDAWLQASAMWLALLLTLLSGGNYLWSARGLLRGK